MFYIQYKNDLHYLQHVNILVIENTDISMGPQKVN